MNNQQENQVPDMDGTQVQPVNVGQTLREARENLGLSVADVANRIKFAPRQIEWLEADDYVRLPEAAFVRGFVRSYARLVELDPVKLLSGLPSSHVQPAPAHEVKSVEIAMPSALSARRHNIIWLVAALVIALSLAIFERLHDRSPADSKTIANVKIEPIELPGDISSASAPQSDQPQQAAINEPVVPQVATVHAVPAPVPVPAPAPIIHQPVRAAPAPAAPPAVVQQPARIAPVVTSKPVVSQPAKIATHQIPQAEVQQKPAQIQQPSLQAPAVEKKPRSSSALLPWQTMTQKTARTEQAQLQPAGQSAASSEQLKANANGNSSDHALRIELDEDAWVEVKDGTDKMLISKMFAAGSLVRVTGKGPMLVTLGNARAARLFDNGKKVNLARYTTAEVAKVKLK